MESKLEGTVNYQQFVDCTLDAAKQNEEPQDRPQNQQEEAYEAYQYITAKNKPLKMPNITSTDVIFTGVWCNKIVAKHQGYHSIAPADMNK